MSQNAGLADLVTHQEYVSDFRTDIKATLLLLCALILILCALGLFDYGNVSPCAATFAGGGLTLLPATNQRRQPR